MPKVTFVLPDSSSRVDVDGEVGDVLMQLAVDNGVEGILGECGGGCSCATCHVHVDPEWFSRVGPAHEVEQDMLEFSGSVSPCSRLACQLLLTDELDGIVLKVVG
jgi:2Fe-2S ferredoxin